MGCCKSKSSKWDMDFIRTDLSANRCDAHWELLQGEVATFGMSPPFPPCARFGVVAGVIRVQIGFSGGTTPSPTIDNPGDHTLAVNIVYDPILVSYEQLLDIFWNYHDIFMPSESPEHQSTIFYRNEEQKEIATLSKRNQQRRHEHHIQTIIVPFKEFILAEHEYQHLILQSHSDVMKAIKKHIRPHQMAHSHLACKLEGYIAGYGTPEQFDREKRMLHIPHDVAVLVRYVCQQNQIPEPGEGHVNDWG